MPFIGGIDVACSAAVHRCLRRRAARPRTPPTSSARRRRRDCPAFTASLIQSSPVLSCGPRLHDLRAEPFTPSASSRLGPQLLLRDAAHAGDDAELRRHVGRQDAPLARPSAEPPAREWSACRGRCRIAAAARARLSPSQVTASVSPSTAAGQPRRRLVGGQAAVQRIGRRRRRRPVQNDGQRVVQSSSVSPRVARTYRDNSIICRRWSSWRSSA